MYKATREQITIDECKDYEIFYAILTFCYSGNIVIDKNNIGELLHLANFFAMSKLKGYCCDWYFRNMNLKTVHTVVDISIRYVMSLGCRIYDSVLYSLLSFYAPINVWWSLVPTA